MHSPPHTGQVCDCICEWQMLQLLVLLLLQMLVLMFLGVLQHTKPCDVRCHYEATQISLALVLRDPPCKHGFVQGSEGDASECNQFADQATAGDGWRPIPDDCEQPQRLHRR